MKRRIILFGICVGMLLSLPVLARQVKQPATTGGDVVYQEWNFDTGLQGWVPISTKAAVQWNADSLPGNVKGGVAYHSLPYSLNYNNGVNFTSIDLAGESVRNQGSATSPSVTISHLENPKLVFMCSFDTECSPPGGPKDAGCREPAQNWDQRFLEIQSMNGPLGSVVTRLGYSRDLYSCGQYGEGTWHQHTVALDPSWGTIKIAVLFETVDGFYNDGAGWFIDDVQIRATGVGQLPVSQAGSPDTDGDHESGSCSGSLARGGRPGLLLPLAALGLGLFFLSGRVRRRGSISAK